MTFIHKTDNTLVQLPFIESYHSKMTANHCISDFFIL